jgi:hypothetical protein
MEQEQTVYCLLEGRYFFAVMPTGIACREVFRLAPSLSFIDI